MQPEYIVDRLTHWVYRTSAYVLLTMGEDAALVAVVFC